VALLEERTSPAQATPRADGEPTAVEERASVSSSPA
jgi:hypothetical protein